MSTGLTLNSLSRFRKGASRLVLEEHGHCEVPAGCGGVVLRWRDPNEGRPLVIRLALSFAGMAEVSIDGAVQDSSRAIVAVGEHVLGIHVSQVSGSRCLLLATTVDSPEGRLDAPRIPSGCTREGGWRCTTEAPTAEWTRLEFDDSAWPPLAAPGSPLVYSKEQEWRCQSVERWGGRPLLLPEAEECWIRTRVVINGD